MASLVAVGGVVAWVVVLAEYQKAPAVTRDRLYIDTMQQVYSNVTKVMIDARSGSNLLYLPLDKVLQATSVNGGAGAATAPGAAASQVGNDSAAGNSSSASSDARSRDNLRSRDRDGR